MDSNDVYWKKQMEIYNNIKCASNMKYKKWQPARWAANKSAVKLISKYIEKLENSLELGAGSVAFSFELNELYKQHVIAIDKSEIALEYGTKIANDLGVNIEYINKDFFNIQEKNVSDLVLSLGVIEHFDKKGQMKFLELCKNLSKEYVLVAIPNQNSTIFKEYLNWSNFNNQSYGEEHEKLDLNDLEELLKNLNLEIVLKDGFQIFLSESDFWRSNRFENSALINKLKYELNKRGITNDFEHYNFKEHDIDEIAEIETNLTQDERIQNCFMNFILARKK